MTIGSATKNELATMTRQVMTYAMQGIADLTQSKKAPGMQPGIDYRPHGSNSPRVWTLYLKDMHPSRIPEFMNAVKPADLGRYVGLAVDGAGIRLGWVGNNISIEIPKIDVSYWQHVGVKQLAERHMLRRGKYAVPLGFGTQNQPIGLSYLHNSAMAHVLISGQTRSGKTNVQKLFAWDLIATMRPDQVRFIMIDTGKKARHFKEFLEVPHLGYPVVKEVPEAEAVLTWVNQEIGRRSELDDSALSRLPKLFVFIDEVANLTQQSQIVPPLLGNIASVGAELGVYLVLATQYPQINVLGSVTAKRNVTTRICGKVDDATAAANILGIAGSGADRLMGRGDMLMQRAGEPQLYRFVAAFIGSNTLAGMPHGRIEPVIRELPDMDQVGNADGTKVFTSDYQAPDPIEPQQLLTALYNEGALVERGLMGITKLANLLGVGSKKAQRIQDYARQVLAWAYYIKIEGIDFERLPEGEIKKIEQMADQIKGSNDYKRLTGGE
jgi:hypothetical protein